MDGGELGTIYLLHLNSPICHARHYIGWAKLVHRRLRHHRAGTGARLLAVAKERGIDWRLARAWVGTRSDERNLKDRKEGTRLCPVCQQHPKPVRHLKECRI